MYKADTDDVYNSKVQRVVNAGSGKHKRLLKGVQSTSLKGAQFMLYLGVENWVVLRKSYPGYFIVI